MECGREQLTDVVDCMNEHERTEGEGNGHTETTKSDVSQHEEHSGQGIWREEIEGQGATRESQRRNTRQRPE